MPWRGNAADAAPASGAARTPATGPASPAARTHTVVIEGLRFLPPTLAVERGDIVVWQNNDLVPHTATAAGSFDSGLIAAGASWHHVMTKVGTLPYVCTFHPTMKAILEVR